MNEQKTVHIIGGGIAGLSAGIFAQLNGFEATIFEMNQKTGGVCSSWERNGYSVNGSIHWLVGSAPGTDLYDLWHQLGVIEGNTFHNHHTFIVYKDIVGKDVHFYTDLNRLEKHLLDISPEDKVPITEFIRGIQIIAEADFPLDRSFELLNTWDWTKIMLRNFSAIMEMGKFNAISIKEFAQKFQSPSLRKAFEHFWSSDMAMTFFLMQLGYASKGTAGYPLGGSGKFIEKLERRFITLGGKIAFGKKVKKIIIENDTAVGIITEDNEKYLGDYIISACDGHTILFKMLDQKYINPETIDAYNTLTTFPSLIYFSAGIRRTFEEVSSSIVGMNIPLIEPIKIGDYTHERASLQIYNFDPTLAPKGKTLITAMLDTDYESWKDLYENNYEQYHKERERIAKSMIASLEVYFEGISHQVDFMDTATPITYKNWTGNHKGSYEGWLPTPEANKIKLPTHFKGLNNFYMAGHWVTPGGGMPPAAYSGRDVIQLICKKEKKYFKTLDT